MRRGSSEWALELQKRETGLQVPCWHHSFLHYLAGQMMSCAAWACNVIPSQAGAIQPTVPPGKEQICREWVWRAQDRALPTQRSPRHTKHSSHHSLLSPSWLCWLQSCCIFILSTESCPCADHGWFVLSRRFLGSLNSSLCWISLLHEPGEKHQWNGWCHLLGIEIFTDKTMDWSDVIS